MSLCQLARSRTVEGVDSTLRLIVSSDSIPINYRRYYGCHGHPHLTSHSNFVAVEATVTSSQFVSAIPAKWLTLLDRIDISSKGKNVAQVTGSRIFPDNARLEIMRYPMSHGNMENPSPAQIASIGDVERGELKLDKVHDDTHTFKDLSFAFLVQSVFTG